MSFQDQEFVNYPDPTPMAPAKSCRYCHGDQPPLEHDEEGWFHPKCLCDHLRREALVGIKLSVISFKELNYKK